MGWFEKYRKNVIATFEEDLKKNKLALESERQIEATFHAEEWIWVNGYKGTDKDMKCRGCQFELNKCFDISDDKPVELCEHGFHLCPKLDDVFHYYVVGDNNRFFEVKALVRKKDVEKLGPVYHEDSYGFSFYAGNNNKLAAKSIIFTRELTVDEILKGCATAEDWTDDQKKLALDIGILETRKKITFEKLVALGYSDTFAQLCMDMKRDKIALSVGTQEGLSMDMKAYLIFNVGMRKWKGDTYETETSSNSSRL